ncbi:unnamed protein product [Amoebophrya sp. A25]|nr:unnamed protein product [Amoebophrya sp. A25]|eukprot:GSA25T00004431001.1
MYAISDLAYTGTMWYASAAMTLYTYWRFHFFPEGWKNWMWTYTPWLVETWNWVNAFANGGFASTPRGGPATTLGPLLILLLSKPRCVPWTHALKCMKYIVYIVIYSNIGIYWGERVIPTVQATMVEVELNPLAVTAVNVGLATFFFSVIVPMGAQIMAAPMVAIARQWADRVGITDEEELMRLEMTGRILINVCFDAFRYAYGRGVLLKIGPLGFTIMLVKDFWYDFWHFVCQYEQSLIVFNLKLDASKHIPLGEIDLPPRTKMYAAFKRRHMQLNKLDVLTAICWKVPFDAAKRRQTTAHGVDPEGYLVNMIRQRSTVVQAVEKRATALAEGSGIVKRMTTWSRTPDNEYINARKSIRASRTSMRQQGVTASQDFKKSAALGSGAGRSSQILRGSRASARFADTVPENDVPNEETTNGQEEKELTEKEVLEVLAVETRDLLTDSYRVAEESMAQDADEEAVLGTPIMNKASDGSVKGGEQGDDEDEEEQAAMRKLATLAPDGTYARAFNFANTSVKCTNCPRLRPFSRVSRDDDDPSANARPTLNLRLTRLASRFQDKHKVDEEDIRRVRHVIAFVQREMFMRFTIRSIIKLVTSSVILFGPLFGLLTDISMSPGFPRPEKELTGTPRIDDQYFVYTLVFFLTDVAVWSLITFQVHFKGVLTWREMLGAYNDQMFSYGRLRPSATMVLWLGYWGQFMLALRWRAYGPIGPLQDAVGVEVEYKHFLHFCPGIYTNWM